MTETHILKDKTVNLAYRMYFACPVVFKYIFCPISSAVNEAAAYISSQFYHQIFILAGQHLFLVTEKRFVDE